MIEGVFEIVRRGNFEVEVKIFSFSNGSLKNRTNLCDIVKEFLVP